MQPSSGGKAPRAPLGGGAGTTLQDEQLPWEGAAAAYPHPPPSEPGGGEGGGHPGPASAGRRECQFEHCLGLRAGQRERPFQRLLGTLHIAHADLSQGPRGHLLGHLPLARQRQQQGAHPCALGSENPVTDAGDGQDLAPQGDLAGGSHAAPWHPAGEQGSKGEQRSEARGSAVLGRAPREMHVERQLLGAPRPQAGVLQAALCEGQGHLHALVDGGPGPARDLEAGPAARRVDCLDGEELGPQRGGRDAQGDAHRGRLRPGARRQLRAQDVGQVPRVHTEAASGARAAGGQGHLRLGVPPTTGAVAQEPKGRPAADLRQVALQRAHAALGRPVDDHAGNRLRGEHEQCVVVLLPISAAQGAAAVDRHAVPQVER
mmetsp:Transcript_123765/g.385398  ORF Transcript_123765/g.385398 Transcript_123765/m.385398 type:complete len:375 (+) Transcript_123765:348-1472(+)